MKSSRLHVTKRQPCSWAELKDDRIGGFQLEHVASTQDFVGRVRIADRYDPRVRRGRAKTSPLIVRHLSGHQQANLTPMILVIRKALVHLGFREHRQAGRGNAFDTLALLRRPITSCTALRVPSTRASPPRTSGDRTMYR